MYSGHKGLLCNSQLLEVNPQIIPWSLKWSFYRLVSNLGICWEVTATMRDGDKLHSYRGKKKKEKKKSTTPTKIGWNSKRLQGIKWPSPLQSKEILYSHYKICFCGSLWWYINPILPRDRRFKIDYKNTLCSVNSTRWLETSNGSYFYQIYQTNRTLRFAFIFVTSQVAALPVFFSK